MAIQKKRQVGDLVVGAAREQAIDRISCLTTKWTTTSGYDVETG